MGLSKVLLSILLICSLGAVIDVSSITNIKKELYIIANSINKDILKYGFIREEIKSELGENYYVEIEEISNDGNLLSYQLSKEYSSLIFINGNKVSIIETVWVNYI